MAKDGHLDMTEANSNWLFGVRLKRLSSSFGKKVVKFDCEGWWMKFPKLLISFAIATTEFILFLIIIILLNSTYCAPCLNLFGLEKKEERKKDFEKERREQKKENEKNSKPFSLLWLLFC